MSYRYLSSAGPDSEPIGTIGTTAFRLASPPLVLLVIFITHSHNICALARPFALVAVTALIAESQQCFLLVLLQRSRNRNPY